MTLNELESISVIAASWATIFFMALPEIRRFLNVEKAATTSNTGTRIGKYTRLDLLKSTRPYTLATALFTLIIFKVLSSTAAITPLVILQLSACTSAIAVMVVMCAYKYVIWSTLGAFQSDTER